MSISMSSMNLIVHDSTFFPFAFWSFWRNFWASSRKLALQVPCSQRTALPPEFWVTPVPLLGKSTYCWFPATYNSPQVTFEKISDICLLVENNSLLLDDFLFFKANLPFWRVIFFSSRNIYTFGEWLSFLQSKFIVL